MELFPPNKHKSDTDPQSHTEHPTLDIYLQLLSKCQEVLSLAEDSFSLPGYILATHQHSGELTENKGPRLV